LRQLFSISQSWYYTRRVALDNGKTDPTTLPGNQMDTSFFAGKPAKGPYGGVTIAYDFRNRFFDGTPRDPRYINLITTGGWAWDCCSFQFQNYTFKAGLRNENRVVFSFTLKGIGTFGTDNIGQQRRRR
jgi:LPS-assembly protein